jgi:hypothetical protein
LFLGSALKKGKRYLYGGSSRGVFRSGDLLIFCSGGASSIYFFLPLNLRTILASRGCWVKYVRLYLSGRLKIGYFVNISKKYSEILCKRKKIFIVVLRKINIIKVNFKKVEMTNISEGIMEVAKVIAQNPVDFEHLIAKCKMQNAN